MTVAGGDALADARAQRAGLRQAMDELEHALAAPAAGRSAAWTARVGVAWRSLAAALDTHVVTTEADDGILADVVRAAPRVAHAADRLRREHPDLTAAVAAELAAVEAAPDEPAPEWVDDRRHAGTDTLARLSRHRQRGADLVYEAYEVDVGGED